MKKNTKIIIGVIVALLAVGAYLASKKTPDAVLTSEIILFYGRECPHCKDVEKFVEENKIREKVQYDYIEVWHNQSNAEILLEKAKECKIPEENVGVPFLYSDRKCFIGAPDVENFLKEKAGI